MASIRRSLAVLAFLSVAALSVEASAQPEPRPKKTGRQYRVRIDSAPQQAAIYLDDEKYGIVGYTPWEGRLHKGDYVLILKLEGHERVQRVIRVERKSTTQETFVPLEKKILPATLDVSAAADKNAFGAEVWIDGQLQGTVPVLANVEKGRHLVEIKKAEFQDFSQWVDVKEGERVSLNPVLKAVKQAPKKGAVLVDADVQDADVYIDGRKLDDKTPTLVDGLDEGPHVVEVRKEPATPWKQTVTVTAGKTVKVTASLAASAGGPGGSVRVLCKVKGAEVFVDGTKVGTPPLDIKDLKPGEHVIEVTAPAHFSKKERVSVNAGSATVLEFDLQPEAGGDSGTVKIVSSVPDAKASIDGERIGVVPQTKKLPAGEHFVRVEKEGYKTFEKKVRVESGQTITVTAELRAAGGLRVLSTPAGSKVMVDGQPMGETPLTLQDVEVGQHVVTVSAGDEYQVYEENVKIEGGGMAVVNATLEEIDTGPTEDDMLREQQARSSFGARTLGKEKPTVDLSGGYPHMLEVRFIIGAGRIGKFGLDAGIAARTFFSRTDIWIPLRLQLVDASPLTIGVFSNVGTGNRFNRSYRNSYFMDAGALISLTAVGRVTITGRAYLSIWTDRFCPPLNDAETDFKEKSKPTDLCVDYLAGTLDPVDKERVDELLDDSGTQGKIFDRHSGLRPMISLVVEFAMDKQWNIWGMLDGTPTQQERPAYTDAFNGILFENDNGVYVRGGMTYKF